MKRAVIHRYAAGLVSIVTFLVAAPLASAQAARLGPTFGISQSNGVRFMDVAFDPANNLYLAVWGDRNRGHVYARAVDTNGIPLGNAFKVVANSTYTQWPRVAYSPAGFLVTFHDSRNNPNASQIFGRIVQIQANGLPTFVTGDIAIQTNGTANIRSAGAVAFSPQHNEFLVTWVRGGSLEVLAQRVGVGGALKGGEIIVSPAAPWQVAPAVDYNPTVGEFYIAWIKNPGNQDIIQGRRIEGGTGVFQGPIVQVDVFAFATQPEVMFDPGSQRWLVAYFCCVGSGQFVHAKWVNGVGELSSRFTIMQGNNSMDSVDGAHNPASGHSLFVFQGNTAEDIFVELNGSGNPGPIQILTGTGALGNYNPRAAGASVEKDWLSVQATDYRVTTGQRVRTGGGGSGGVPSISINDVSQAEGDAGTTQFTFTASLSAKSNQTITVDYDTANGATNPASAGSDYTSESGIITFPAQTQTQQVTITVAGDATTESNETFFVNLSSPSNATISDNTGVGTILNDDGDLPAPTVAAVSPASGATAGNTSVTITGTNFSLNPQIRFGGVLATNVVRLNGQTITANTPPHTPGPVTVEVSNADNKKGSKVSAFTYVSSLTGTAPTVTSISPTSGPTGGGTAVTIRGTNFTAGAVAKLWDAPLEGVVVVNETTITGVTRSRLAAGAVPVIVMNPDGKGAQLLGGFTYVIGAPVTLTVTNVSPNSGPGAGGTNVTITGTNFAAPAAVTFGGANATNVVVVNGTTITARTPPHAAGLVGVAVTSAGRSASLANAFTYASVLGVNPTVTSVTPNVGPTTGGTLITIKGTNFQPGATAKLWDTPLQNIAVVDSTTIRGTTGARLAAGPITVIVTNPDGKTGGLAGGFTYVLPTR